MATRRTTGSTRTESPPSQPQPQSRPQSRPQAQSPAQPAEKAAQGRRSEPVKPAAPASGASTGITVSEDARRAMIAQAAYLRAERRGFAGGDEVDDWLAAEAEVDALLKAGNSGPVQH